MLKRDPLHLARWNMWWLRMERLANTEERARKAEINRQVAANKMRKFLGNTCMTPDKKKRNGNHICTAHTESTGKRQQLSNTNAESPAKRIITPISVKLREGTNLGISSGDNDKRVA